MPVTSEVRTVLDAIEAVEVAVAEQTPEGLRLAYAALSGMGTVEDVASVTNRSIPGPGGPLPIRVYVPAEVAEDRDVGGDDGGAGSAPCLVWFHGGGWVIGDVDTHDNVCRSLANAAGLVVVSVDYRLAPENPFPAAVEDALAAVRWVIAHAADLGVDPARLAVGGDSAGGNLAATVSRQLRDQEPGIGFQLLVYPVLDARLQSASVDENAEGYFLTKEIMFWFRDHYLGDGDRTDPRVSPACVPDAELSGLPPGLVITAEFDPLRDEGNEYGERCRAAGVDMTVSCYDGMIHGFFSMADMVPEGRRAIEEAAAALRAHVGRPAVADADRG